MPNAADEMVDWYANHDFFSRVGEPLDAPWGVSAASTWRSAFTDWQPDWGATKILRLIEIGNWCEANLSEGKDFVHMERDRISMKIDNTFRHHIWRILPESARQLGDRNERWCFQQAILSDLWYMPVESQLVKLGMPPDIYTAVHRAYREGHFPCGWQGEYPSGRLVVY